MTDPAASDVQGKVVLITGATSGIGRATAAELASLGARVFIVGRDQSRLDRTVQELNAAGGFTANLAELAQVQDLAARFARQVGELDVLVNNAGALFQRRQETSEGLELTWALNYLSPFLLTRELLPLLRVSTLGRVVNVSSKAHVIGTIRFHDPEFQRGYVGLLAYAQSKLASLLFTRELARREEWLQVNALHPGTVASAFGSHQGGGFSGAFRLGAYFMKTPQQGAQTSVYLASHDVGVTGRYFRGGRMIRPASQALDDAAARRLWALSEGYLQRVQPLP